jgi:hypothetical protein
MNGFDRQVRGRRLKEEDKRYDISTCRLPEPEASALVFGAIG